MIEYKLVHAISLTLLQPAEVQPPPEPSSSGEAPVAEVPAEAMADAALPPPLPAAPPPVDPTHLLPDQPWRGSMWFALRLGTTAAMGGNWPAKATVASVGAGVELGLRIHRWVGTGMGVGIHFHDIAKSARDPNSRMFVRTPRTITLIDFAIVRMFIPATPRFDPYVDVGAGLASLESLYDLPGYVGGQIRAGLGFDGWVSKNLTLGLGANYRAIWLGDTLGHHFQTFVELGIHR